MNASLPTGRGPTRNKTGETVNTIPSNPQTIHDAAEEAVHPQQPTHDPEAVTQAVTDQQQQATEPETRDITIRVPTAIPDPMVAAAWNMGVSVTENARMGVVSIVFPHYRPHPKNPQQMVPHIAKIDCLVASAKDIERLLHLANTISQVNTKAAQAAQNGKADPIGAATASITADITKENATADAVAQANGKSGGIVIATGN